MGPGLPGQRSVLVAGGPGVRRGAVGAAAPAPCAPTASARARSRCSSRWPPGEIKACWIICTNPVASVANRRTVIEGLEAAELVITQDVFADTETNAYADVVAARRDVGRVRRRHDQLASATSPWPGRPSTRPARRCRTGSSSPGSPARWGTARRSPTPAPRRSSRRSSGSRTRRPATTCAGSRYDRLRRTPVQWPAARRGRAATATRSATCGDGRRPAASPPPSGRAVFHARPHLPAGRNARRRLPVRAQHRPAAAPVAHADQDRQGRQAQQAEPRAVRGDPSARTRERLGHRRRRPGRGRLAARPGGAARAWSPTGCGPGSCFAPFHWNDLFGEYLSVNAVTNDAVDPLSFQPEFKVCAVSLTKVADSGAGRAAGRGRRAAAPCRCRRRRHRPARADRSGSTPPPPPVLTDAGTALPGRVPRRASARRPPRRARAARRTRPSARSTPCGSTGCSPAMFSRGADPPRPPVEPRRPRRPGQVLWASQTGNAEELRRPPPPSGSATGRPRPRAARHGRGRPGRPARAGADLLCHQHLRRRRRPRQRRRLLGVADRDRRAAAGRPCATPCSPSATPATTTSAGTAAGSTSGCRARRGPARPARGLRARLRGRRRDGWLDQVLAALAAPAGRPDPRPTRTVPHRRPPPARGAPAPHGEARARHRSARRQPAAQPARRRPRRSAGSPSTPGSGPARLRGRATRSACWPLNCPRPGRRVAGGHRPGRRQPSSTLDGVGDGPARPRRCTGTSTSPGSPPACCASSPNAAGDRAPEDAAAPRQQGRAGQVDLGPAGRRRARRAPGPGRRRRTGPTCSDGCSPGCTRSRPARSTDPHLVSLTVSVVRYENHRGRPRKGVCSHLPRRRRTGHRGAGLRAARRRTSGRPPTPPPR